MSSPDTQIDGTFKAASAALWVATIALAVTAVGKIALYGQFRQSASDACDAVVDLEPAGGWSDSSFPCEQFAPMGWVLPYWLLIAAYVLFTVLFLVAAVKAGKASPDAPSFVMVTAVLAAVLCVVPSLLDLDWIVAIASANQADTLVAERIRDDVPGWFTATEIVAMSVVLAASALAAIILQRKATEGTTDRP